MVKTPIEREGQGNPGGFPLGPPRDLHPTSDIRFVMHEVGKLTANVDRLIADVASHGTKIDQVRHQVSFVKGALWVSSAIFGVLVILFGLYIHGQFSGLLDAIGKLAK